VAPPCRSFKNHRIKKNLRQPKALSLLYSISRPIFTKQQPNRADLRLYTCKTRTQNAQIYLLLGNDFDSAWIRPSFFYFTFAPTFFFFFFDFENCLRVIVAALCLIMDLNRFPSSCFFLRLCTSDPCDVVEFVVVLR